MGIYFFLCELLFVQISLVLYNIISYFNWKQKKLHTLFDILHVFFP